MLSYALAWTGRQENNPRTFKEICAVVSNASKKDIGRCYKFITKELEQAMGTIHAADYLRRFGSRLGLANKDMQAAEEAVITACPRDGRCVMPRGRVVPGTRVVGST